MCRRAAGKICVISAIVLALPLSSTSLSSRDRMAELSLMIALAIRRAHCLLISISISVRAVNSLFPAIGQTSIYRYVRFRTES
jgi:hypothetical protein